MKLKREHLVVLRNAIPEFRGWLFFLLLFTGFCAEAQVYSVSTAAGFGGDNDAAEVIATEAPNTGTFVIRTTVSNESNVTVNYTVTGTASPGADQDYEPLSESVTFQAGSAEPILINVNVLDDDIVENAETVVVTLTSATEGQVDPIPAEVLISDVTDVGVITLDTETADFIPSVEENGDFGQFSIILDKENGTDTPVTVSYTISGSGIEGTDYNLTNDTDLTFNNDDAERARNIRVAPIDDTVPEPDKTVIIELTGTDNPLFSIGAPATATITIVDEDCVAGDLAPTLNNNTRAFCDGVTVNLDSYFNGTEPAGANLIWSTNTDPMAGGFLADGGAIVAPGTYYGFFADIANDCFSPTVEIVITEITSPSAGSVTTPVEVCNNNNDEFGPTRVDLESLLSDDADDGDWVFTSGPATLTPTGGNSRVDFRNQPAGDYEFTYTTTNAVAPCLNESVTVVVVVTNCDLCVAGNVAPVLTEGQTATFCGPIPEAASLNDFTSSTAAPTGTTLIWTTNGEDFTDTTAHLSPAAIDTFLAGDYYAVFYDAANDCASPPLTVSIQQNDIPIIATSTGNSRCGPGTLLLTATGSLDATLRWYTTATDGVPIRNGANFTTPDISQTTSYFVEAIANGCVSPRTEVVATVIPQPSAGVPQNASSCNTAEFGATIVDLDSTLSGTPGEGVWSLTEGPSAVSLNAENVVDFQGSASGSYVFMYTTTGAEAPCENATAEVTISVSSCDTDEDGDGLLGGLEAMLGTDPNNADTDGDSINDGVEVGDDPENPLDEDEDGIIDALDSNTVDTDLDGVFDQQDPANENACIPNRFNGQCDTDGDGISDLEEDTNGSDPDDPCDPNATPNCADPINLQVLKEVDILDAIFNDQVVFTITVNNLSDRNAINVMIEDVLDSNSFEFSADAAPEASVGEFDVDTGLWLLPEIAAMGSATLTIPVRVLEGGAYTNTATLVGSIPEDNTTENNIATVTLNVELPEGIDLVLEKSAAIVDQKDSLKIANFQAGQVNPLTGQEIIFKLKVINDSNEEAVTGIEVLDSISPVFANPRFTPELEGASAYNATTGQLKWVIPELLKNGVAELEIRVALDSVGTFQNTAEIDRSSPVDSEGKYGNNTSTVTVNVSKRTEAEFGIIFNQFSPNNDGVNDALKINKRRTNDDGTLGDEVDIQYSIKIFNRYGSLVFEGVQLTDEVIWDGTRKSKELPDGTYFYVLDLTVNEEIEGIDTNSTKKGWIQVIR